jgi:hypothetical protein
VNSFCCFTYYACKRAGEAASRSASLRDRLALRLSNLSNAGHCLIRFSRLLAELHHSRTARIRVAGGGAGGDAPDAEASALGLPHGQPQPPKRLSPSWDTTNHGGVQREVSGFLNQWAPAPKISKIHEPTIDDALHGRPVTWGPRDVLIIVAELGQVQSPDGEKIGARSGISCIRSLHFFRLA